MSTIQKGKTKDVGTKFWEIFNDAQTMVAAFNHNKFPHIRDGVEVYFIDLDLDRLCENVQVIDEVDKEILSATPAAGIQNDAEAALRNYVMSAFFHALEKQGSARSKYLSQLRRKMVAIRTDADLQRSYVTLATLEANGIG